MQTYYDPTRRAWVTEEANGRVRQATFGEALAANQQAQAPPGVALPNQSITAENAQEFSPAPGITPIDATPTSPKQPPSTLPGDGLGGTPQPPSTLPTLGPGFVPPPPPPTGWGTSPAQTSYGWGTGFTGSQAGTTSPFADLTGVQQAYYTKNPDQANYLLRTWLAPNPSNALNQYLGARQGDMTNQFATDTAKTGNGNLQYTDWLKQNFGHYVDQFAGQSATQRGENPLAFGGGFAGRKTFA